MAMACPFDDINLDQLLKAPEWTDAHECFQEQQPTNSSPSKTLTARSYIYIYHSDSSLFVFEGNRPYDNLYGQDALSPLWLYARTCIEEELEAERLRKDRDIRNRGHDSTSSTSTSSTSTSTSAQPPVNRLPRTLLARIFLHLRNLFLNTTTRSKDSPDRRTHQKALRPYAWLYVTLVCRRWRSAAYTCPRLWTWVGLSEGYDRELVRSLLILSGEEPLRVFWDTGTSSAEKTATTTRWSSGDEDEDEDEDETPADNITIRQVGEMEIKLDLVMDERARVEELEFSLETMKFVRLVPWNEFVARPWTRLTRFLLRGPGHASGNDSTSSSSSSSGTGKGKNKTTQDKKKESRVLPALKEGNFPRLRELILDGLDLRWDETHLPELIRLEIRNIDPRNACSGAGNEAGVSNNSLEAVEFDRFLSRCTQLRTLNIPEREAGVDVSPPGRVI
ncbi:hypothetical protein ACEPAF_9394 [Sanghuangporus sanghuang]